MVLGPLGLVEAHQRHPGTGQQPHPVTDGAVVLDVADRAARVVDLDVRRAVPVGLRGHQAALAGVVREHPPGRVGDREGEPAPGHQQPGHLGDRGVRVGDELQRPEGREDDVEGVVGERQRGGGGAHRRDRRTPLGVDAPGVLQLAQRHVEADGVAAVLVHPAGALAGAAAQLEHPLAGDVAEQPGVVLGVALGPPHEAGVAQERAVGGLVLVGVAVPVAPVGLPGGLLTDVDPDRAESTGVLHPVHAWNSSAVWDDAPHGRPPLRVDTVRADPAGRRLQR